MPARFVTWSCPVAGKNFVHNCKAVVEIGPVLARRGVALRQAKAGISGNSDVTGPVLSCNGVFKASEGRDWWEFGCYRFGFGVQGRCFKASESRD